MTQKLLSEFDAVPFEKWKALVEAELKGVPFEKKLVTRTWEGIDLQPIYTAADTKDLEHLKSKPGYGQMARGGSFEGYAAESWKSPRSCRIPVPASSTTPHDTICRAVSPPST